MTFDLREHCHLEFKARRQRAGIVIGYRAERITEDTVYLIDTGEECGIPNCAEGVIDDLAQARLLRNDRGEPRRVVYRDSYGAWDELKHDGRIFHGSRGAIGDHRTGAAPPAITSHI